ncbi:MULTISPECIES: hypothetical protein [Acetobacter]|uniref:Uncharacterized protein n=4 Tax=Acetobacter TaxID=434 RepID=A0A841QJA1_9PROT|nr:MULTISPECIES: hypothetical protein [Acetobacter]ASC07188.1 hypothetical protein S101468_02987 [Acetobacter pasteurianus subsp. pasteurianus]MBB6458496.1 hypothetical protein [Acetobacter lovaniensis]GBQ74166.1 hypothetical protein AA0474_3144 [Acetobacter lovaniensis NRIC 0474]GCD67072.1 hypothetical protein NBRC3279_2563 [Acetobacter pasteurianus NBRC 3279]GCD73388.1 hypothetical protein NBRC3284_2544 [Acetobacter pasteurianus NBRC 3284]
MYEDNEMRVEIRARLKGRIRYNVTTDQIEVMVGEDDELLRWETIDRRTMSQHLPPTVIDRLWDMICDAAGSGVYADDRLAGVQFLGLHRIVDHLEREGLRIEAVPVPSLSPPALVAVTLAAFLAARERTTLAEIMQNVIDVPPEKELLVMLKNAGWESRRTATGRFWVKTRG